MARRLPLFARAVLGRLVQHALDLKTAEIDAVRFPRLKNL